MEIIRTIKSLVFYSVYRLIYQAVLGGYYKGKPVEDVCHILTGVQSSHWIKNTSNYVECESQIHKHIQSESQIHYFLWIWFIGIIMPVYLHSIGYIYRGTLKVLGLENKSNDNNMNQLQLTDSFVKTILKEVRKRSTSPKVRRINNFKSQSKAIEYK